MSKEPSKQAQKKGIAPCDILKLQESTTKIDLQCLPEIMTQIAYPHWLIWEPVPNNYRKKDSPCTKILKKPSNPNWAEPNEGMPFSIAESVYKKRCAIRSEKIQDILDLNLTDENEILQAKLGAYRPVGLGFIYTPDHPFICVDIDELTKENLQLIEDLNSYTEVSPSGNGLHVIVKCTSVEEKHAIMDVLANGKRRLKAKRDLFIGTGYVTITGLLHNLSRLNVRSVDTQELLSILTTYFMPKDTVAKVSAPSNAKYFAKPSTDEDAETSDPTDEETTALPGIKKNGLGAYDPLTATQVKNMLAKVPVRCLEDDIFERLFNDEYAVINTDCTDEAREPWLMIGQAIHHNFEGKLEGYYLWDSWSKEGSKYDATACETIWRSFKNLERPVTIGALIKLAYAQQPQFPDRTKKGSLKGTLNNFLCYQQFFKFKCFHNAITKESEVDIPDVVMARWQIPKMVDGQKLSLSEICELMRTDFISLGFTSSSYSSTQIKRILTSLCKTNSFNPIKDYFEECAKNWDGKDRLTELCDTIKISPCDKRFRKSYNMFLRKWLLQVVVAACHPSDRPVRLNRVLIFSGPQDAGKTKWVESLFPPELLKYCAADKEIRFSSFRTDSVKQTMELATTLICNINEIDRLFKVAAYADFKAFLDQTVDKIVLPYGDSTTEVTRRTVFIGSTNAETFLKDVTGNRRFEIIYVKQLMHRHGIDIGQLWGQIHSFYKQGENWWLEESIPEEAKVMKDRDTINARSMYIGNDAFIEQLDYLFDVDKSQETGEWNLMTFKEVRTIMGLSGLITNSKAFNQAKIALQLWSTQVSGEGPQNGKGVRPRIYYTMPVLRDDPDACTLSAADDVLGQEGAEDWQVEKLKEEIAKLTELLESKA